MLIDYIKGWPQYLMPGHLLSRGMHAITRIRHVGFKNAFLTVFLRLFDIKMEEAEESDPYAYESFNAFFTRALKPGVRPIAEGNTIACPVDGTISQFGTMEEGRIFQAKGHDYSALELLGGNEERAKLFEDGSFNTIYLAPYNYHRIHIPVDGTLKEMVHVPGRLFSVNPATARTIPRLFARNERVVALFDTEIGPMAMVMVGAVFVGSIETVWAGEITPPAGRVVRQWTYKEGEYRFKKGDEVARFNMGSTVILLFGKEAVAWEQSLSPRQPVQLGQKLADIVGKAQP